MVALAEQNVIDLAPAPCLAAHLYKQTIRGIAAECKETDVREKENRRIGDTEATPLLVYEPFILGLYDGRYENARAVLMPVASWLSVTRTASAASRWRGWRMVTPLITTPISHPDQPSCRASMTRHQVHHVRYWSVGI